ncbi:DUF221-domain-containing protein [Ascodesmis nigricans]|uniref:DUF221-domain-containing protein n=1 Tax=Ascodesmis nigricans TaxID=341454 RepID=A0A4S2MXK3_9PEZI|nr:DUF221-domain-containing protein [Ascodesmis nigricans]
MDATTGSCQLTTPLTLLRRQTSDPALNRFLELMQSSFRQTFSTDAFLASLGSSLGVSALIFCIWCLVRPHHSIVYAPKLRHANSANKKAPPPVGKGYFSWIAPLVKCHEDELVNMGMGLDAVIFLRFMRLCRTLFFWLGLLGCIIMIPVNITCNLKTQHDKNWNADKRWFTLMSPTLSWGECMWAHVVVAWVFDIIIVYFLWRNYRQVVKLRRDYFESPEYTRSLHSRTLMIWDIPSSSRSDLGLVKLLGMTKAQMHGEEKSAIGRNVKQLPELLERHSESVRKLEKVLTKYLKNPDRLPATRPTCKPDKDDKSIDQNMRVDAIEYHKNRMDELERKIIEMRKSIDSRDPEPYGFLSFPTISRAHIAAKVATGKHPKGTSIKLASRPSDIIWDNLRRSKSSRRWNRFIGNLLFTALSLLYVIPNALIAIFLSNMNNIGLLWPEFNNILARNHKSFAIVQGFAAPTVTSLIYLLLPICMRRLSKWQGDLTRSSRERHVVSKLYVFFIINNLIIFTIFSTLWSMIQDVVIKSGDNRDVWQVIKELAIAHKIAIAIFDVSTFWITYLLQRNLGAMLDLIQIVPLVAKSFATRFRSPTTRQRIEWTAPPYFDYATYYNYFLFYVTIALCFSTIQPLVLPVAWFYFFIDSFMKKYTLMYVFITKVESGGTFWRVIFNRILFATGFFNCVVGLVVWVRNSSQVAVCVLPLFAFLIAFKIYCRRTFDTDCKYYTKGSDRDSALGPETLKRKEKLDKRYSHPALHRKLLVPMVPGKAEHLLSQIFTTNKSPFPGGPGIDMDQMQRGRPGHRHNIATTNGFEVVQEADMDFTNFMHRAEFGDHEFGDASTVYNDGMSDRGSIATMSPGFPPSNWGSPANSRPGSPSLAAAAHGGRFSSQYVNRPGSPSPLSLGAGGGGYRGNGMGYEPVMGVPSPGMRPESPYSGYDYGREDARSETEAHLLSHQQMPASGGGGGGGGGYFPPPASDTYRGVHR